MLLVIREWLGLLGIVLTICYTIWKWHREFIETKKSKNESGNIGK